MSLTNTNHLNNNKLPYVRFVNECASVNDCTKCILQNGQLEEEAAAAEDDVPLKDMQKLRNWLVYKSLNANILKVELSKLLTTRSMMHRSKIPEAYKQRYGSVLMEDIGKVIKNKKILELIAGLFQRRAQFEAYCIHEIICKHHHKNAAVEVAEMICCKSRSELQLICDEYHKFYGHSIKDKVYKLSSGKTYQQIIENMFDFEKNESTATTSKVKIEAKVCGDVEFLMDDGITWKKYENKLKLAMCVMSMDKEYVHRLNALYFKESNTNLIDFVDEQLGQHSTAGSVIKIKIEQSIDFADYFARKIQIEANDAYINRIFVATFDTELAKIQKTFNEMNYGDGKTMIEWINKTHREGPYALFLIKMLENCS